MNSSSNRPSFADKLQCALAEKATFSGRTSIVVVDSGLKDTCSTESSFFGEGPGGAAGPIGGANVERPKDRQGVRCRRRSGNLLACFGSGDCMFDVCLYVGRLASGLLSWLHKCHFLYSGTIRAISRRPPTDKVSIRGTACCLSLKAGGDAS